MLAQQPLPSLATLDKFFTTLGHYGVIYEEGQHRGLDFEPYYEPWGSVGQPESEGGGREGNRELAYFSLLGF